MFIATNRLRVRKGTGNKLEERFAIRQGVERQAGFLGFEMWKMRPDVDEGYEEYLIVTHWESEEHQKVWVQSDGFKRAHSGPPSDFIVGHPKFAGYDVRMAAKPEQAGV